MRFTNNIRICQQNTCQLSSFLSSPWSLSVQGGKLEQCDHQSCHSPTPSPWISPDSILLIQEVYPSLSPADLFPTSSRSCFGSFHLQHFLHLHLFPSRWTLGFSASFAALSKAWKPRCQVEASNTALPLFRSYLRLLLQQNHQPWRRSRIGYMSEAGYQHHHHSLGK